MVEWFGVESVNFLRRNPCCLRVYPENIASRGCYDDRKNNCRMDINHCDHIMYCKRTGDSKTPRWTRSNQVCKPAAKHKKQNTNKTMLNTCKNGKMGKNEEWKRNLLEVRMGPKERMQAKKNNINEEQQSVFKKESALES